MNYRDRSVTYVAIGEVRVFLPASALRGMAGVGRSAGGKAEPGWRRAVLTFSKAAELTAELTSTSQLTWERQRDREGAASL